MVTFSSRIAWLVVAAFFAGCTSDAPQPSVDPPARETTSTIAEAAPSAGAEENDSSVAPQPSADVITADGWGPLRIGMSVDAMSAAGGADADPDAVGGADPARCDEFRPQNAPQGVLVMVENGVLTRISVSRNRDIRTGDGFRVGDPASEILAHYGTRAQVEPHKYWESPAKNILVWRGPRTGADARGIRYEIGTDGAVAHIRAGGPSIELVEGCS